MGGGIIMAALSGKASRTFLIHASHFTMAKSISGSPFYKDL